MIFDDVIDPNYCFYYQLNRNLLKLTIGNKLKIESFYAFSILFVNKTKNVWLNKTI